jgi:phage-related tail fiber protein
VTAASTGNLTLSGTQTVNTVVLASGDRVLVKNQTDSTENGIYDVDTSSWTRSYDFNGNYDIKRGTLVYVTQGSSVGKGIWTVTAADPITIDTDNITFASVLLTT